MVLCTLLGCSSVKGQNTNTSAEKILTKQENNYTLSLYQKMFDTYLANAENITYLSVNKNLCSFTFINDLGKEESYGLLSYDDNTDLSKWPVWEVELSNEFTYPVIDANHYKVYFPDNSNTVVTDNVTTWYKEMPTTKDNK